MSNHTPGPWKVSDHSGVVGTGIIAETEDHPHPWVLCLKINGRTEDERAANARLIASAPTLIEALKAIIEDAPTEVPEYEDWGGDTERAEYWGGDQEHWRLAQIARKALAEAGLES